jgi:hypothetical protein
MLHTNSPAGDDGDDAVLASGLHRRASQRRRRAMDAPRFDALARSLSTASSRRRALVAAFSGALSVLGLADPDVGKAAKSGKCKRKPNECETCKKGKCEKKDGKKTCKRGKIKPKAFGTACSGGSCQNGLCIGPTSVVVPPPPLPPPPGCVPEREATTCATGCGNQLNNCNQVVSCLGPSGQDRLPNGTCARPCTTDPDCAGCTPMDSGCTVASTEGQQYCIASGQGCGPSTQPCDPTDPTTTGCPQGFVCIPGVCAEPRCIQVADCPAS